METAAGSQISCHLRPWRRKVAARQRKTRDSEPRLNRQSVGALGGPCSKSVVAVTAKKQRGLKKKGEAWEKKWDGDVR